MSEGLTPVIATVLLMTISVGAVGSTFVFLQETQSEAQETAKETIDTQQSDVRASINMEFAYNGTEGHTIFSLRNTGDSSITLEDDERKQLRLFVNGRPVGGSGAGWEYTTSSVSPPVTLDPGQTKNINTTKKFPGKSTSQVLKVSGPKGTEDAHNCYNSGSNSC